MLKARRDQALGNRVVRNAQCGEHFERGGMGRCGARLFVVDRIGFEYGHLNALLRQRQCCHRADRPGTRNHYMKCHARTLPDSQKPNRQRCVLRRPRRPRGVQHMQRNLAHLRL